MNRVQFSTARTGRRAPRGGGMLKSLEYKMGERKRLVFPIYDGGLVLFAKPYHKVYNSSVELAKTNGSGTYAVNKIRCTHPFSQTTPEETQQQAKKGEICLFCDISKYEGRRRWATINEEFGKDGFSQLDKKEQKAYFEELQETETVDKSYYSEEDEEGNRENRTLMDIFILALELQLDKKGKPALDEDGAPKYEPVIMPASKSRLEKFKQGVDDALASGSIELENLNVFIENEGTEAEEEVFIGFVDFMVTFPKAVDKMTSGRNMTATPVPESSSVDIDDLMEDFDKKAEDLVKQAENMINNFYVNLKPHTRESALEMLVSGEDYFTQLEDEYRMFGGESEDGRELPNDDETDASIIERALKQSVSDEDEAEDEETEEEEKPKKKEKSGKKKTGKEGKKRTKPSRKEEPEEDLDVEDDEDEPDEDIEEKPKKKEKSGKKKTGKSGKKTKKAEEPKEDEELDDDDFDEEMFDVD